jgi:hypothetical protein
VCLSVTPVPVFSMSTSTSTNIDNVGNTAMDLCLRGKKQGKGGNVENSKSCVNTGTDKTALTISEPQSKAAYWS